MQNERENQLNTVKDGLNSKTGGFTYSLAVAFYFALMLVVSIFLIVTKLDTESDAYIYINYLIAPVAISLCILTVLKLRKLSFKSVFPVKCSPKYYLIAVLLIYGLLFSLSWIDSAAVELFKLFGYKPRESSSYFPSLSGGRVVAAMIVIAVIPAVMEEALFRGVILNSVEKSAGSIRTIFIVGFCFSLFHASPEQTVYQFLAGCAFAFLAIRSGSILPSVVMHFLNNALLVIFGACNLYDEAGNLIVTEGTNIALIVTGALCLIGGLVWLILDKKPLIKCSKGGVKSFFLYGAIGIGVLGLVWILSLFGVS